MEIIALTASHAVYLQQCAQILFEVFEQSWNTLDEARAEVASLVQEDKLLLGAVQRGRIVGFGGATAQYAPYGWELHPLAVAREAQRQGIGSKILAAIERKVAACGGLVLYLGADDETGATSLSHCDLFDDPFGKISRIRNIRGHPFAFYRKNGYQIVGVLPDVNGYGKPDILMAKRLREPPPAP